MLKYLTLTGIDVRCNISELKDLQEQYPRLEYGVLLSKSRIEKADNNRYPNLETIKSFVDGGLKVSCHVCGSLARKTMQSGKFDMLQEFLGELYPAFQRFQFNINGCKCSAIFRYIGEAPIIIQTGTPESKLFYQSMHVCDTAGKVQALVDASGGTGKFSGYFEEMPKADEFWGFAGGLGVDNLSRILIYLNNKLEDKEFWVDMESSVRTDDWFDMSIARKLCEIAFKE